MRRNARGILVLAVAMLAAGALAITPAFSAAPLTKAKVKKIATRIAKREAKKALSTLGPGMFIEEDEMFRFHFGMDVGQQDRTIGTFGPFTFKATCSQPGTNAQADILIATSEAGSIFNTNDTWEQEFDPADGFLLWLRSDGEPPGGLPYDPRHDMIGHAASPTMGITAYTGVYNNIGGSDCVFQGNIVSAPRTA
jgi:hypothetical protein